jgi:succinylarginine dihydrolase
MRLCSLTGNDGCYVFVYGSDDGPSELQQSRRRPPRQSKLASQLVAQSLQLPSDRCFFVQQTPEAIDAGVFHNDVIATSHENLLLYHEQAFVDSDSFINQLSEQFSRRTKETLLAIQIHASELSLAEAVNTYLFNSQIVTDSDGGWRMICPSACEASDSVQSFLARLQRTVPRLKQIDYVHLQQSMANGGGPACLRFRVILDEEQILQLPKSSIVTEDVAHRLQSIIETEYPTHVTMSDLIRLDFALHAEHIANQIAHVWQQ